MPYQLASRQPCQLSTVNLLTSEAASLRWRTIIALVAAATGVVVAASGVAASRALAVLLLPLSHSGLDGDEGLLLDVLPLRVLTHHDGVHDVAELQSTGVLEGGGAEVVELIQATESGAGARTFNFCEPPPQGR